MPLRTLFLFLTIAFAACQETENSSKENDTLRGRKIQFDNAKKKNIQSLGFYKTIYRTADSLNMIGNVGKLDTSIFSIAESLSKLDPSNYFIKTADLLAKGKFNEASFLYYLGYCRFKYFNSVDPNYQASSGGALLASFKSEFGEPVQIYLRTNPDNYISILYSVLNYYSKNDYKYYSRNHDLEKYNRQEKYLMNNIASLKENKIQYTKDWIDERIQKEKRIDSLIANTNPKH